MNFGNGDEIRVASQLHTGVLSPSKDSYMPALIEVGNDRTRRIRQLKALGEKEAKAQAERQVAEVVPITSAQLMQRDAELAQRMMKKRKYREKHVLQILFDHEKFAKLQQDFERNDGVLDLEKFLISVLVNFDIYQYTGSDEDAAEEVKGGDSEDEGDNVSTGPFFDSSASSGPSRPQSRAHFHATASSAARGEDPAAADPHATADLLSISPELLFNVASIVELFRQIDVHSVGEITWEEASTLLIEQGKRASSADGATLTLDTKSYHESAIQDTTKHDANVERIVYVKEINALATFSQSRKFRIYDPKRLTLKAEVSGHRGSVITCAYIEPMAQLATCASDMTICLWDATSMKLRSRIVCRDVQICLCYHASVDPSCLYSGSIDGTLSKWHLTTLSLKESRRGHKGEINDLLVLPDMLLIASASSDGTIILWDIQTFRPKKHLKGHKKSVLQLAYSMGCLLSVGLDQEALVWNPYVETSHLFKLKGHAHSLVGIGVGVGSYPQLVTGDIGGILRVWDVRNFRCAQVFGATDAVTDLTCFCVIPELKRIACGVGNIRLYDYVDSREHGAMGDGGSSGRAEEETDPLGVRCCAWEPHRGRFVTLSRKNLKIWDAETGCMIRMLKDLFPGIPNELTAFCVSSNARKLIVGNAHGTIASFSTNGKFMREFSVPNAVGEEVRP
ncbi:unnamed protein product [Amoebophrya sp. A25]|nr:unnamed protein product [Amoebophrya sp. A25]|eukprot:GSA25T00005484001.1